MGNLTCVILSLLKLQLTRESIFWNCKRMPLVWPGLLLWCPKPDCCCSPFLLIEASYPKRKLLKTQKVKTTHKSQEVPGTYHIHKNPQGYKRSKNWREEETLWPVNLPANCAESPRVAASLSCHPPCGGLSMIQLPLSCFCSCKWPQ